MLAADLLESARGEVLDLGGDLEHLAAYARSTDLSELVVLAGTGDVERLSRRAAATGLPLRPETRRLAALDHGRFESVVSVFALISYPDLTSTLRELRRVLAPGGRLLLIEPFTGHGKVDRALGTKASLWRATQRLHLDRAIASAVREEGFVITAMQRVTVRTNVWPLRRLMAATAMPGVAAGSSAVGTLATAHREEAER